ncbi:ODF3A protein, partial [Asarcornis scutulata]|nr:ODF3A protein [Asarcornis scutulata]
GDYHTEASNKHVFKCPPVQSMAFQHEASRADQPPGKATPSKADNCSLSELQGQPAVSASKASPGLGKEKSADLCPTRSLSLSQTPGPTAFPKIEVDTYKRRAPIYTTGAQTKLGGDRTVKPGPADYRTGK